MTESYGLRTSTDSRSSGAKYMYCHGLFGAMIAINAFISIPLNCAAASPAAGDTYAYQIINGYNNETQGQVAYCVERRDDDRIAVAVTNNRGAAQWKSTEIYTPEGNWLRHPLTSHDRQTDYEFSPAFPAYDFPLVTGKQWSTRVNAVEQATGARRSVRVDATVHGNERLRVPVGEFDTIKIDRSIYPGDADRPQTETIIVETEWYAPSLGRSVRKVTRSYWLNLSQRNPAMVGDWNIYELVSAPAPRPGGC